MTQVHQGRVPPATGSWYWSATKRASRPHAFWCSFCRSQFADRRPAFMAYVAAMDDGYQTSMHPGWDRLGWLAWFECPRGHPELVVVAADTVAACVPSGRWMRLRG